MAYRGYGGGYYNRRLGGMLSEGVRFLLIVNGLIFLLQMLWGDRLVYLLGLTPADFWERRAVWQPLTYMFLHGGLIHLAFNMFALWMFGSALEEFWGTNYFLRYYFITGIGAGLCNALLTPESGVVIIGASGAVYGLLAAYGILFPNSMIYLWMLFPIRAKYLVLFFGGIEFVSSLRPGMSPVAHLVHLGGMVIGVIYLRWRTILNWFGRSAQEYRRNRERQEQRRQTENEDNLRREVDDLLDKINEVGLDNLTSWEKRRLREASDRLKEMERERR